MAAVEKFIHRFHRLPGRFHQRSVLAVVLANRRNGAVVIAVGEGEDTVHQVAVGRHQLIVIPAYELAPGKIGVPRFGHVYREQVAQWVGVISIQVIQQPYRPVATGGKLPTFDGQELVGRYVVRQVQVMAVAEQYRRPDKRVKRYVVLADEIVALNFAILPEITPFLRVTAGLGPLYSR